MQNSRSIIIGTSTKLRWALVIGYVIFGLFSLRDYGVLSIIVISIVGAAHIWYISSSFIELNTERLVFSFPPKRIQINWEDVKLVELNKNMVSIQYGEKQIGMALSPKSTEGIEARELIVEQCKKRKIEIRGEGG